MVSLPEYVAQIYRDIDRGSCGVDVKLPPAPTPTPAPSPMIANNVRFFAMIR